MNKHIILLFVLVAPLLAQERADLTVPQVLTNTSYRVSGVSLDWDTPEITIALTGTNGERKRCAYTGPTATAIMIALNKANLTTRSLKQRILDRVIADGCIVGTVAGAVP